MDSINKKILIVTEGESDAQLLRELLPENKLKDFSILPADGFSSALSKVKSLLIQNKGPILFLLDSDTTDKDRIEEKKEFVDTYINSKYYNGLLKTIWAIPEFEIIFFDKKNLMEDQLNKTISDDVWELAKISPKNTLERIFNLNHNSLVSLLENNQLLKNSLKESKIIKEILDFSEYASV
jgi:hypothetical protein